MTTTHITQLQNTSDFPIVVTNDENPSSLPGGALHIPANQGPVNVDISIPWCSWDTDFTATAEHPAHRIHIALSISVPGFAGARDYYIWQANQSDGDHVRACTDGVYYYTGHFVNPVDGVGGNRKLTVFGSKTAGVTSINVERV